MDMVVVLDNIRSAHNVGSIFRTADGAGVSKMYLTGYTPAPIDRFGRVQTDIEKTSLGATHTVSWEAVENIEEVLDRLQKDGYEVVAVEQHRRSKHYKNHQLKEKTAFVFGNEVEGVQAQMLERADAVLEVPMYGQKESLNVSVAAGVILFHFVS